MKTKQILSMIALLATALSVAQAQIIISEVDPAGSSGSNAGYSGDWFELKNIGSSVVDITGWKMDDSSDSFSSAVLLRNVTSIAAGQAVVFIEGTSNGTGDTTLDADFTIAWFGANAPAGLVMGNYGGSGVGLSQTSDGVHIFDGTGTEITGVSFGATSLGNTLDNEAGLSGMISQTSQVGVNGAFLAADGLEVGSPGDVTIVPEPGTWSLESLGLLAFAWLRRRQNQTAQNKSPARQGRALLFF